MWFSWAPNHSSDSGKLSPTPITPNKRQHTDERETKLGMSPKTYLLPVLSTIVVVSISLYYFGSRRQVMALQKINAGLRRDRKILMSEFRVGCKQCQEMREEIEEMRADLETRRIESSAIREAHQEIKVDSEEVKSSVENLAIELRKRDAAASEFQATSERDLKELVQKQRLLANTDAQRELLKFKAGTRYRR